METHRNGARFKPSEKDLTHGCVLLSAQTVFDPTVQMRYPGEFLARVKADAPFSLLWPGHAVKAKDASRTSEGGVGGRSDQSSGGGGGAAGAAAPWQTKPNLKNELIGLEIEKLGSGLAPFFHAGYTAYFEITLEKTAVPPPLESLDDAVLLPECVAIGLAYDRFGLE